MTNLFISLYPEKNEQRAAELAECLRRNAECKDIDRIFIFAEHPESGSFDYLIESLKIPEKCEVLPTTGRPTFKNFFEAINHLTEPNDINIIANSDIYFEEIPVKPTYGQCFALTRYDIQPDGSEKFLNMRDSQDCWLMRGKINIPAYCSFTTGVPGCDNRLGMELLRVGYEVTNPSLTIKTYHLHSGEKSYDINTQKINPPYLRITPTF